jgi:hypothetical protein
MGSDAAGGMADDATGDPAENPDDFQLSAGGGGSGDDAKRVLLNAAAALSEAGGE